MRSMASPAAAKCSGKSPHASPSLRLFTSPAWLIAESVRSFQETRVKSAPNDVPGACRGESPRAASKRACPCVSRTKNTDSASATATETIPSTNGHGRNPYAAAIAPDA